MSYPERFENNVRGDLGYEKGQEWLDSLSSICKVLEHRYKLSDLAPITNLSWNYVCTATMPEHGAVIVKICCIPRIGVSEIAALRAFASTQRTPQLVAYDEEHAAIIMEQVPSGKTMDALFPQKDVDAVRETAALIKQLHSVDAGNHPFPHLKEWLASILSRTSSIYEPHLAELAAKWGHELLATSPGDVLLHGDLHHENMLYHEQRQRWVVIDPLSMIGEPAAEVGAFIRNPVRVIAGYAELAALTLRRIQEFSELLDLPYERVYRWSFVMSVLGMEWAENTPDARCGFKAVAQTLYDLSV